MVDPAGAAPGGGRGASAEGLDELLSPPAMSSATRAVFLMAHEALERVLPFDVKAYRADRIGPRDTLIRPIATEIARWFGVGQLEIYATAAAPRVCVPVDGNPVTLLIGADLLNIRDEREKAFILTRAVKIATLQMSVAIRAQPSDFVLAMAGLVNSYDPNYEPKGLDPGRVADAARRVAKYVPRKFRDQLQPLVFEMAGRPGYDPATLAMGASELGDRVALVAIGSMPAAVGALARLSGEELPAEPAARMALVRRHPEIAALVRFAISDEHFEARRRAGVDPA